MDDRTIASRLGRIALPVVLLGGCAAILIGGFIAWATPDELDGYSIRDISCEIDPVSKNAILTMTVTQLDGSADELRIEPLSNQDLALVGDDRIPIHGVTNVVLELHKKSGVTRADLPAITFWWSPGEPAFVQDVELDLFWKGSTCSVHAD